jgi:histidine triad (HIT) family protein
MSEENCIFCKIIRGEMQASIIFEDEHSVAFMDVFPIAKGHCLLVPRKHYENMFDVDLDIIAHLAKNLVDLTKRVQKGSEGVLNIIANGEGAGQDVPHLHFHAIPRNKNSPFGFRFPPNYRDTMAPRDDLDRMAEKIRSSI